MATDMQVVAQYTSSDRTAPSEVYNAARRLLEPRPTVTDEGLRERQRDAARAAFSGRPPTADGQYVLMSERNPWRALDDALAAVAAVRDEELERLRRLEMFGDEQHTARLVVIERIREVVNAVPKVDELDDDTPSYLFHIGQCEMAERVRVFLPAEEATP